MRAKVIPGRGGGQAAASPLGDQRPRAAFVSDKVARNPAGLTVEEIAQEVPAFSCAATRLAGQSGLGTIDILGRADATNVSTRGDPVLYVIIERFRDGDPVPVYRRFQQHGRLAPEGLTYLGSWVTTDFERCYQVMECGEPALLEAWIAQWQDLVDFEVIPVRTSAETITMLAPKL